jgi:hypothetical protein
MTRSRLYRRIARRETHASRTAPTVVVSGLLILVLLAFLVVTLWYLNSAGGHERVTSWMARGQTLGTGTVVACGVVAALVGVWLISLAVTPGRRPRHSRTDDRQVVVVDDGVLADAVATAVARQCGISRRQVAATVGRTRLDVRLTPFSGQPVDKQAARDAALQVFNALGLHTSTRIVVADRGVVG